MMIIHGDNASILNDIINYMSRQHGQARNDFNDKFYTPQDTVNQLLNMVSTMYPLDSFDTIIEPSAGDGAILKPLETRLDAIDYKGTIHSYDLIPEADGIQRMNWLERRDENGDESNGIMYYNKCDKKTAFGRNSLVIGNPPFGRNGSLALKFINESASFARVIAFIVPLSFMKASRQNSIDEWFHVDACEKVVDDAYILPDGNTRIVPTCILILSRQNEPRVIETNECMVPFEFCGYDDDPDWMIVRVGGRAGTLLPLTDATETNRKYNYFIRLTDSNVDIERIMTLAKPLLDEQRDKTTGSRSLSKTEIKQAVHAVMNN